MKNICKVESCGTLVNIQNYISPIIHTNFRMRMSTWIFDIGLTANVRVSAFELPFEASEALILGTNTWELSLHNISPYWDWLN